MRNIIIVNISALPMETPSVLQFASDIGDFSGQYTNEAPIKYLLSYIKTKNAAADLIIAVTTPEAEPAFQNFKGVVKKYSEEIGCKNPTITPVLAAENEMENAVNQITQLFSEGDNAYIDTTGGFRNSSYLLMAVVRVLEYSGIGLAKAVYAQRHGEKRIEDVTSLYKMFDLINAVNSFSQIGDSRQLEEYFKYHDNEVVKRTISAMNDFSDEISLCRTSKLDDVLKNLNSCLSELSELDTDSKDIILLQRLSNTIQRKFGYSNNKIEYPDIVKWCLDNKMIQQAVTIYVEKMPEYFYKKKYYIVSEEKLESIRSKNESSHNDFYYELFYSNFLIDFGFESDKITGIISNVAKCAKSGNHPLRKFNSSQNTSQLVLEALTDCIDYESFARRTSHKSFRKYEFGSVASELKRFFKIKNAFYFDKKLRNMEEIQKRLEKYPEVAVIIKEKQYSYPNTIEGFIVSIDNNKPLSNAIFHPDLKPKFEDNHLNVIEYITNNTTGTIFKLTDKLSKQELQSIFRDIYYAKTFIRNRLNHASEESSPVDELKEYFGTNGYQVDSELNVNAINEFLYKAINKLKL